MSKIVICGIGWIKNTQIIMTLREKNFGGTSFLYVGCIKVFNFLFGNNIFDDKCLRLYNLIVRQIVSKIVSCCGGRLWRFQLL